MARYAVKIGEIHLRSATPITEEQRQRAKQRLLKDAAGMVTNGAVAVLVDGEEA